MIYLSDDYVEKYKETLCYLLERAVIEEYSFDFIEKSIAHSLLINELEKSNITLIAFSSLEKNYRDIFPYKDNKGFVPDVYGIYGWISSCYIDLFLKLGTTFEMLFIIFPIKEMLGLYQVYHEMSFSHLMDLFKEKVPYTYLDNVMKYKNVSSVELANETEISFATINAIRYGKRDINKLESYKLLKISRVLGVKIESLLSDIDLVKE